MAIAIQVHRRHGHFAGEGNSETKERPQEAAVLSVEHLDQASTASARAGHDICSSIVVHIPRGHKNPPGEICVIGEERKRLGQRQAVEYVHLGAPAWPSAGDDVRLPISIHVADGHSDPASEYRTKRKK